MTFGKQPCYNGTNKIKLRREKYTVGYVSESFGWCEEAQKIQWKMVSELRCRLRCGVQAAMGAPITAPGYEVKYLVRPVL